MPDRQRGASKQTIEPIEQWFIGRGIPHLIADYSARTDIWTRALPLLGIGYLLGGLNALDISKSLGWNAIVAGVVLVILALTWALMNRLRHRQILALPTEIGPPELAVFVAGPSIPSFVLGQWGDGVQAILEGLVILAVVYLVTSYGLLPMFKWAASRARAQLFLFFNVVVRVLPLLLLAITFLFVNAEVWQVAGTLHGWPYWVVIAMFVGLGAFFVLSRVPTLVTALSTFDDWSEVGELVVDTPAEHLRLPAAGNPDEQPLDRRERLNIGLVSVFSQALQITLVVVAIFSFFVLFGFLAINEASSTTWTQTESVHVLVSAKNGTLILTEELLRVAGFLAAFAGMYFTVALSTDSTYREEFAEDVAPQVRQAFAVRIAYLHSRAQPTRARRRAGNRRRAKKS
jgi:hypothetical protein